jgi:YebC/PmpR family DNA-binding regulatory protein
VFGRNYECNIKGKKGPAERLKAKITAKHLRNIIACCREGGPDESSNSRLSRLIKAAIRENVPRDTITRRIKALSESKDALIEMEISGIGVQGVAVVVNATTDNAVRCRQLVKEAFKSVNGKVGNDGSLSHIFRQEGVFMFEGVDEDTVMEAGMEAEVEDVQEVDGKWKCTTLPENFNAAMDAFDAASLEPVSSGVETVSDVPQDLNEEGTYELLRLVHLLEDLEDVDDVHHNGILQEGVELTMNQYDIPMKFDNPLREKLAAKMGA